MELTVLNQLGEWNPQLFRELKGRLRPRNIVLAVAISLIGQLLLLMNFASQLPVPKLNDVNVIGNRYCTGTRQTYPPRTCLLDGLGGFVINWPLWWKDVFVWLSIIGIFVLLVGGIYMLITDLAKEERRGTLNFLRLSPQSSLSILTGKMLGVPILLYLIGALAFPLHLVAGLSGQISLGLMLGYYAVFGASCCFFYSLALLFGLVGKWLAGFQAWLGSGVLLIFLYPMTLMLLNSADSTHSPFDWLMLFNPEMVLPYLIGSHSLDADSINNSASRFRDLLFFYLPVGSSIGSLVGLMVLNYGLWTYGVWQGLKRCFHNPNGTLLGKQQSYWLTAGFEAIILGFALNPEVGSWRSYPKAVFENFQIVLVFNLVLFLGLLAALLPQRQAMQDWARYRHKMGSSRKRSVMQDLIWGEKSPGLVAVVLNLAIASSILLPWIVLWTPSEYKIPSLWGLVVSMSMMLVYAVIAQMMLLMKTPKRAVWATASVGGLIALPPIIFGFLMITPESSPIVWLFSAFPWASLEYATGINVFLAVISQSLAFGLLSLQLKRQLQKAGESSTKALLSGRSSVAMK
ncbi:MAG TPA: ABC transporter permease subunit [Waterburya sp.]|jgi:hypothetical protein